MSQILNVWKISSVLNVWVSNIQLTECLNVQLTFGQMPQCLNVYFIEAGRNRLKKNVTCKGDLQ